jgi:hypothetical protein
MFKKIDYKRLNYGDLERIDPHDIKRDEMRSVFLTFDFLDLIKKWPDIVGAKLAAVTSPLKIKQDSLFVITKHSSYSEELNWSSEMIKKEVFKHFPNLKPIIKKLAFQTQENFFEQKKVEQAKAAAQVTKLHPQSPKYKLLKLEADRLFADIEDEELRTSMISIYIQSK